MRFFTLYSIAAWFYPEAVFRIKSRDKILCLTFDDGPDPESTPKLLKILDKYNVKAVFFCDGMAAELYPDLVSMIREKGHLTGNHGYNHLNGWVTSLKDYVDDVNRAARFTSYKLFRPPYGLLRFNQYRRLRASYKIFFWDVMPYDFDREIEATKSLKILSDRIRPGSVIVLHDTRDSTAKVFLDEFLDRSVKGGFRFLCPDFQ